MLLNDILKKPTNLEIVYKFYLGTYNFWQSCQIVYINISLDRSIQHFCIEVLFVDSGSIFIMKCNTRPKKKNKNYT